MLFLLMIFYLINSPVANCSSESDSDEFRMNSHHYSSESDSDERGNHFQLIPLPPWPSLPFWTLFPGLWPKPPPTPVPPPPPTKTTTTPQTTVVVTTESPRGDNG
nr:PREDICTED: formin-like protein 14 [Paralichthys olivaceus]